MNTPPISARSATRVATVASISAVTSLQIAFPQIPQLNVLSIPALIAIACCFPAGVCVVLALAVACAPLVANIGTAAQPWSTILASATSRFLWSVSLMWACLCARHWRRRYTESMATDELTGLANRRAFLARLQEETSRSQRTRSPLTLLFVDCDDFKHINDSQGHLAGDAVLRGVAESLSQGVRQYDTVARFAGDEFIILCPHTNHAAAENVASRLMELLRIRMDNGPYRITFSMGVATFEDLNRSPQDMIAAVDQAMYQVKRSSKNAVSFMRDNPSV